MKIIRFISGTAVLVGIFLVVLSLGNLKPANSSPRTPVPVSVIEGEWFVTPSPASASDHFIMFNVTNVSGISSSHEFVVVILRHGQTYDNLPISTDPSSEFFGRVDEDALEPQIIGAIEEEQLPAGGSASLTVGMPPGNYALICNLPGHYLLGMRSLFTNEHPNRDKGKHYGKDDK